MFIKLSSNPNIQYFIIYSILMILDGSLITCLGPIIPYLSSTYNHSETEYSFIFICRAIGYIVGGITVKMIQKFFSLHQIIMGALALMSLFSIIFCYCQTMKWIGLLICFLSIVGGWMEVALNLVILAAHVGNDQYFWVQLIQVMFGVGGLFGPLIVYLFQLNTLIFLGILFFITIPFIYRLQSPQSKQFMKQCLDDSDQKLKDNELQDVPNQIALLIYILFFLYIGIEVSFGGWVASFTVIKNVGTKEQGTQYTFIFWVSVTLFRFIFAFIPGKVSQKLIKAGLYSVIAAILGVIIIFFNWNKFGIIFSGIFLGLFYAPVFPILLTISAQYKMKLNFYQISNIMVSISLGEAILSTFVGYLMGFNPNMLFYSLAIMSIIYLIFCFQLVSKFKETMLNDKQNQMKLVKEVKQIQI